jgi:anti-anti-sigma regulatory factor
MARRALPSSAFVERRVGSASAPPEVAPGGTPIVFVLRDAPDLLAGGDLLDLLVREIAGGSGDVLVDLADVDFLDTDSFFALAATARFLDRKGRRLTFRSPSRLAIRVLDLFGLSDRVEGGHRSL